MQQVVALASAVDAIVVAAAAAHVHSGNQRCLGVPLSLSVYDVQLNHENIIIIINDLARLLRKQMRTGEQQQLVGFHSGRLVEPVERGGFMVN